MKKTAIFSGILTAVLLANSISAAGIPATVTVGTGVLIPMTDIRLNDDSITLSELADELAQQIDQHGHDSNEVDSNMDSIIPTYFPQLPSEDPLLYTGGKKDIDQDFSYEEFLRIIQNMDTQTKEEYEEWIHNADQEAADDIAHAAEELIEYIEQAREKEEYWRNRRDEEVPRKNPLDEFLIEHGVTEEELINLLNEVMENGIDNFGQYDLQMAEKRKEFIRDCLRNGAYDLLEFQELEENAYKDDTMVYVRENNDYTDIMYRCATCGKTYSYHDFCNCGKVIYSECYENGSRDAFNHFTDYGGGAGCTTDNGDAMTQCTYCLKVMTKDNIREFLMQQNQRWTCRNCYFNEGPSDYRMDGYSGEIPASESMPADFFIHVRSISSYNNIQIPDNYHPEQPDYAMFTLDNLDTIRDFLEQYDGKEYPEDIGSWDEDIYDNFKEDLQKYIDGFDGEIQSGEDLLKEVIQEAQKEGIILIQDSDEYEDAIKKIFGGWPSDQSHWTEEMKTLYTEFMAGYENNGNLQSILDSDLFQGNPDYQELIQGLNQLIAGHTSITDKISTSMVIETSNSRTHTVGDGRTIMGYMKAWVVDTATGTIVWGPVENIDGSIPLVWPTTYKGTFAIRRTIDTYYVTAAYTTYDMHIKWVVDGSNLPPIYEKTISRIRQDTSGTNERNRKTNQVNDVVVNVVEGTLRVDTTEDYATERIY